MVLDRGQILINFDTAPELLGNFSFQGPGESFFFLYLSPGKFPRSGQVLPGSTLTDEHPVVPDQHGTYDFQHGRPLARGSSGAQGSRKDGHCPWSTSQ